MFTKTDTDTRPIKGYKRDADNAAAAVVQTGRRFVGAGESISIGATSAQSSASPTNARAWRVVATVECWIDIGPNPTAATGSTIYMPPNHVEYFECDPGDKVAVIQSPVGTGSLHVRPTD